MKLGVSYPQREVAGDPGAVRRFIQAAEDLGYEYMTAADHVVKATHDRRVPPLEGPYTRCGLVDGRGPGSGYRCPYRIHRTGAKALGGLIPSYLNKLQDIAVRILDLRDAGTVREILRGWGDNLCAHRLELSHDVHDVRKTDRDVPKARAM